MYLKKMVTIHSRIAHLLCAYDLKMRDNYG